MDYSTSTVSVFEMIAHTGPVGKLALIALLGLSTVSWAIMFHKYRLFKSFENDTDRFKRQFHRRGAQLDTIYNNAKTMKNCPMARVFLAGYIELAAQFRLTQDTRAIRSDEFLLEKLDSVARALERAGVEETTRLEGKLFFLGTTGATAPFIGLFGTVWGVMDAFAAIGSVGSANVAAVAPGIAEALIATAAGIFTAVPAVIGYNYFIQRVKIISSEINNFALDFLSLVDRIYVRLS